MKMIVFGASGFIGRHTFKLAQQRGYQTLGTRSSRNPSGSPQSELLTFDLLQHRVSSILPSEFRESAADVVAVHCTTFGGIDSCVGKGALSRQVNVDQQQQLMRDLDALGIRQVYLSSSYVFDGTTGGYREDSPCCPQGEYGRQKRDMELFIEQTLPDTLVLRLDKTVGTDPHERHLFSDWIRRSRVGEPIRCIRNQWLSPTVVDDVAESIVLACERGLRGLYHVANTEPVLRDELAARLLKAADLNGDIRLMTEEQLGLAEARPQNSSLDSTAFRAVTGYTFCSVSRMIESFVSRL